MYGLSKQQVLAQLEPDLANFHIRVARIDDKKLWGIEALIDPVSTLPFLALMFRGAGLPKSVLAAPVGPKVLLIQQDHRLSWHVHERRDSYLQVRRGSIGVYLSRSDVPPPFPLVQGAPSETIHIGPGIRHRLSSLSGWAVVAEISRHTDPAHPSDDADDERRISDDYGRK